jgi:hypothetical protein
MIKQIVRFLLVLGISAVVSGAMYLIFTNTNTGSSGEGDRPAMEAGVNEHSRPDGGGFRGGPGGERDGGQLNGAGLLLNLGKVSIISAVIVLIDLGSKKLFRKRKQNLIPGG